MTAEHNRAWVSGARVITLVSLVSAYFLPIVFPLYRSFAWTVAIGTIAGYLMGRYVEPRLDTPDGSLMAEELGFIGFIGAQYWTLYAIIIRILSAIIGINLSRTIILGTLLRVQFANFPIYLFARLAAFIFNFALPQGAWVTPLLTGQFIGLAISDAICLHFIKRGENVRQPGSTRATRSGTGRPFPDRSRRGPRER